MCVSACAVDFKGILALMAKVNWEVKEVMSQHSQYVDILLRVCAVPGLCSLPLSLCWNCKNGDVLFTGAADIQYAARRGFIAHSNPTGGVRHSVAEHISSNMQHLC
jgi:hypothetical protein